MDTIRPKSIPTQFERCLRWGVWREQAMQSLLDDLIRGKMMRRAISGEFLRQRKGQMDGKASTSRTKSAGRCRKSLSVKMSRDSMAAVVVVGLGLILRVAHESWWQTPHSTFCC
ncbi:MAG: hypothetical protein R6X17_08975 [Candidatus Competibacteraceae bacterium]